MGLADGASDGLTLGTANRAVVGSVVEAAVEGSEG